MPTAVGRGSRTAIAIVSPSLAPTWKVTVDAALSRLMPLNDGALPMRVISDDELVDLGLDRALAGGRERAVLVLHGELADALQHRVDLVEVALRGLHHRDAVLDVALRLGEAADLAAHLLGDAEAGGVVGRAVDAEAGREPLHRLARSASDVCGEMTVGRWASMLVLMRRDIGWDSFP